MSPRGRSPDTGKALSEYRAKRDFSKTAEPRGERPRRSGFGYLIQKHAATRLHYDFRLELDGVLKSWAVTRGPSLNPADKRLAVHVEDHPIEYGEFEGLIPKGEYGGGTVLLWDTGEWEPISDPNLMYDKGHLSFLLHGEKLQGKWELVRMRKRSEKEKGDNWLLIKSEDAVAQAGDAREFLEQNHRSVKSGLTMEEIAQGKTGAVWSSRPKTSSRFPAAAESSNGKTARRGPIRLQSAKKAAEPKPRGRRLSLAKVKGTQAALPEFVEPQKATRVDRPPNDDGWIHEIKLDGYRAEARMDGKDVRVLTRTGLDWTPRFLSIADAVRLLPAKQALMDGEIVAMSARGVPDFGVLQDVLSGDRQDELVYYAFDLLYLDGLDLRDLPLIERKALLQKLLEGADQAVRYSEHFEGAGDAVYQQASKLRLEGVVSKRAAAPYRSGRVTGWVKSKCRERQEFVIGGFSEPSRPGPGIGSLLLGQWDKKAFTYTGRVGTGFTSRVSDELRRTLEAIEQASSPFDAGTMDPRGKVHFVKPKLVCEVELAGWTTDGMVRQASFLGLRADKDARSVKKEVVAGASEAAAKSGASGKGNGKGPAHEGSKGFTEARFVRWSLAWWKASRRHE